MIENIECRSPLKWLGGKFKLLDYIFSSFPKTAEVFYEPFFGGGSVGLNARHRISVNHCVFGDTNPHLMAFWQAVKWQPEQLLHELENLFIPANNTDQAYRVIKQEFNKTQDSFRKAVLFLYLNKHCFNSLCRFNSSGEFNAAFGQYEEPKIPYKELENATKALSRSDLRLGDFRSMFLDVKKDDIIYCDPPYVTLSKTANFTKYSAESFTFRDHEELVTLAHNAADRGATVVISNHHTPVTKKLYESATDYVLFEVQRNISVNINNRKSAAEMIVIYHPFHKIPENQQLWKGDLTAGGEFFPPQSNH